METYHPSKKVQEARTKAYDQLHKCIELKDEKLPHFAGPDGERSFNEYIDHSERILNGYTPSKEEQGKEEWQSNVMDNITRAKMRAIAASVGLKIPEVVYEARNKNGVRSTRRAEVMKQVTRYTFLQENPTMQSFLEVWGMLAHGVLWEYEGYMSGGAKQKVISYFNVETGEFEFKEEYRRVPGRPISIIISPNDIYFPTFYVRDHQKLPYLFWVQRYNKSELETEFSKYKNYKYVLDKKACSELQASEQSTYGYDKWSGRVEYDEYEVVRKYSKEEDLYEVWVNGIQLLSVPMLWSYRGQKHYPFAKSISEPFANADFLVGMSFPALLEAYQENKTTITNTLTDILYRSLVTPMLVGLSNKDLLEVEAELVDSDNRIYVPDVAQVKPMPQRGIQQADLAMLEIMDNSINRLSIDAAQQGVTERDVTATAIKIADERARQQKGMLFLFLEDLWVQKYKLRHMTILTSFIQDKSRQKDFRNKTISVNDVDLGDEKGWLDIHIAKSKSELLSIQEIEAREEAASQEGMVYKLISVTKDYLDNYEYDYTIIPESLHNQDRIRMESELRDKIQMLVTLFPEYFAENKQVYLEELLAIYGDNIKDLKPPTPPQPVTAPDGSVLGLEGQLQTPNQPQNAQQLPTGA